MAKMTLVEAQAKITTLEIMLKQHIATENALRTRIAKMSTGVSQRKPWVRVRRMDDGQWAVFLGDKQQDLFPDFSSANTQAKVLSMAH